MAGLMFTIKYPGGPPSLSEAARKLRVQCDDLDQSFGVVLIDPKQHLYTVLVNQDAAHQVHARNEAVKGPFANPQIGVFGPAEPE